MTQRQGVKSLHEWLAQSNAESFPNGDREAYMAHLQNVRTYLDDKVYRAIETGALLTDGVMLTRHGGRHVNTVVRRARDLLMDEENHWNPRISPYEGYLLLMAIYVHDIGNLKGRAKHEKGIASIIEELEVPLREETVENKAIIQIAQAHGGTINGTNRDTIGQLASTDTVSGFPVRMQALAAVMRFADEIADDSSRSERILMKTSQLPEQSQVYHQYAKALHSVTVLRSQHAIDLHFLFHSSDAIQKFYKGDRSVYLVDEIYSRTLKMYRECEYCMRFTYDQVRIDTISVKIVIHKDNYGIIQAIEPIGYRLAAHGYPDDGDESIHDRMDGLMTGSALAGKIQEGEVPRDS